MRSRIPLSGAARRCAVARADGVGLLRLASYPQPNAPHGQYIVGAPEMYVCHTTWQGLPKSEACCLDTPQVCGIPVQSRDTTALPPLAPQHVKPT